MNNIEKIKQSVTDEFTWYIIDRLKSIKDYKWDKNELIILSKESFKKYACSKYIDFEWLVMKYVYEIDTK